MKETDLHKAVSHYMVYFYCTSSYFTTVKMEYTDANTGSFFTREAKWQCAWLAFGWMTI
jgi:hypothetical protein